MKKLFIRKCSRCKNIVRLVKENDEIVDIVGAKQMWILSTKNKDSWVIKSQKMVLCTYEDAIDNYYCLTWMYVRCFKEVQV